MKAGQGTASVVNALFEMREYSIYHFLSEESLLEKVNYPELLSHKKEHKKFIKKVDKLKDDIESLIAGESEEVMTFLKKWWETHILLDDKKFSKYLK